MDALKAIRIRRSVRSFLDKPISKPALEEIVDAARFAPTARNIQPWEFVVVTDKEILKALAEIAETGRFIAQSSACIAVFCQDTKYYLEDGSAATVNILNAAAALNIGSCWVAGDKKPYCQKVSELLKAPAQYKLVSLIALGYPESEAAFKEAQKRDLKELLHWNNF